MLKMRKRSLIKPNLAQRTKRNASKAKNAFPERADLLMSIAVVVKMGGAIFKGRERFSRLALS